MQCVVVALVMVLQTTVHWNRTINLIQNQTGRTKIISKVGRRPGRSGRAGPKNKPEHDCSSHVGRSKSSAVCDCGFSWQLSVGECGDGLFSALWTSTRTASLTSIRYHGTGSEWMCLKMGVIMLTPSSTTSIKAYRLLECFAQTEDTE